MTTSWAHRRGVVDHLPVPFDRLTSDGHNLVTIGVVCLREVPGARRGVSCVNRLRRGARSWLGFGMEDISEDGEGLLLVL